MPEYALLLFAVLLLGAVGVRKMSPGVVNGADTTRRILSGENVNVTGNAGNPVNGVANATQGNIDPNGDGNSIGTGGTTSGGSSSSFGAGSIGVGGSSGGGSTAVGGGGSGASNAIAGASAGGGGVLLGASGATAFAGADNLGGGGGLTLGSFSTESASGGGAGGASSGSGSSSTGSAFGSGGGGGGGGGSAFGNGGGAGSSGGNGLASGGAGSSAFAGSSGASPFASAGNALVALFSSPSSQSSRAASSSGAASSGSANEIAGRSAARSTQSQMPLGLLGASRSNEVNPPPGQGGVNGNGYAISAEGERQMQALLAQARRNVGSKRPKGRCYHQVKIDIQEVGYGNIPRQTANGQLRPLPGSDQGYAHDFADYMNARAANGQTNATNLGLQKLPITNPYDAPPGSIIVVRAGTPGTRNPVAGDIVVAGGNGHFYNDGNMGYGGSQNFRPGNTYVLGIYAPR